jgi:hypothetical protein
MLLLTLALASAVRYWGIILFIISSLQEQDPFWEPVDTDILIGSVHVYLQSIAYLIEVEENLTITDFKGLEQGHLAVEIRPCNKKWAEVDDEFVEDPSELVSLQVSHSA